MSAYLIVSAIVFTFLAVIWNSNTVLNIILKTTMIIMTAWSLFMLLELKYGDAVRESGMKLF